MPSERNEEPEYETWLRKNANRGFVANHWPDGTFMRHHADCYTLAANRYTKTTPDYPKICALSLTELSGEIEEQWNPNPDEIRDCSRCWDR
jgi:hypothetical protein